MQLRHYIVTSLAYYCVFDGSVAHLNSTRSAILHGDLSQDDDTTGLARWQITYWAYRYTGTRAGCSELFRLSFVSAQKVCLSAGKIRKKNYWKCVIDGS